MDGMHQYQKDFDSFALDRLYAAARKGVGLAADPGVGKTFMALHTLMQLRDLGEINRVLICGPPRPLLSTWPAEIAKWDFPFRIRPFGTGGPDAFIETISRDSLHRAIPFAGRWDAFVVDESHGHKRFTTKRMRSSRRLLPSMRYRLALSGTPQPNNIEDWMSQTFLLDDGESLGRSLGVFRARYMRSGGFRGHKWLPRTGAESDILSEVAKSWYRISALDHLDLPEKVFHEVQIDLPDNVKRIQRDLKIQLAAELEPGQMLILGNAASAYAKLKQLASGFLYDEHGTICKLHELKLDALEDIAESLDGRPLIVFYQYKAEEAAITARFPKVRFVSGGLTLPESTRNIQRWLDGGFQMLAVQHQAGGEGINAQTGGCCHIVFLNVSEQASLFTQSIARVWRQGAKGKHVFIYRISASDSIEQLMLERVDGKISDQDQFLEALKGFSRT